MATVVFTDATRRKARGDARTTVTGLRPGVAALVVDQRFALRINIGGALQKGKWRQRDEVVMSVGQPIR